jgi:hypothetical protein
MIEFIEMVRCQPCCMPAINRGLQLPYLVDQVRKSDPHHLKSFTNNTRRHCDWFVVPLSRANHSWIDTLDGKLWEKENVYNLYQYTGNLLVAFGIYKENPFTSLDSLRDDCYTVLEDYKNAINS